MNTNPKQRAFEFVFGSICMFAGIAVVIGLLFWAGDCMAEQTVECPERRCFSQSDAADCVEAEARWNRCKEELREANQLEAQYQKALGQLEEQKKLNRQYQRTIRKLDRETATKYNQKEVLFYAGAGAISGFAATLILCAYTH